jgi:ribonuclease BN (tRNA processing enzyme)
VTPSDHLRVTVLGSSNAIPRPKRACSAYLVEGDGSAILADLGSGSLGNLNAYRPAESIDAVVISHMHADHFLDIIPMRYALKYGPRTHDRKVALVLPPGGETLLRRMVSAFVPETSDDFLGEVFEVGTYDPSVPLEIGDMRLTFAATAHYLPTFAMRCECSSGSATYSADTAPCDAVVRLAEGSTLFLCEATLKEGVDDTDPRGHCSAREAGAMAKAAEVERLVITHYPAEFTHADLMGAARSEFEGELAVADDHSIFQVFAAGA